MGDPGPSAAEAVPGGGEIPPEGPAQEETGEDEQGAEAQGAEAQEVPRRRHPRMPSAKEVQEHEDQAHAVFRAWCKACCEGRGLGAQHRREFELDPEFGENVVPIVAFDYGFMTQEGADTYPILVVRETRFKHTAATCVEAKGVNAYAVAFM
eukprot:9471732-Pyramimonas_sp.AAC.1